MEICEEEIERTSQEAVKAALLEVGGELAYEKERADQFELLNTELKVELQKRDEKEKRIMTRSFWNGVCIGVGFSGLAAGIISVVFK